MEATVSGAGTKEVLYTNPNEDSFQYRFDTGGLLSRVSLNGEVRKQLSYSEDETSETLTSEHLQEVEEAAIGDLTGKMKKRKQIAATERLARRGNEIVYVQEKFNDEGTKIETIKSLYEKGSIVIEAAGMAQVILQKADAHTLRHDGPGGQIEYKVHPETGALETIHWQNGDSIQFLPGGTQAGGAFVLVRVIRGERKSELTVQNNRLIMRDFFGNETVYHFMKGLLVRVDSPAGSTEYTYTKEGRRLTGIRFPDRTSVSLDRAEVGSGRTITVKVEPS
jgi:YD repeat-containing protein